jgi:SAM-dependent methyltransferase
MTRLTDIASIVKRVQPRGRLEHLLDETRFRLDTFPRSGRLQKLTEVQYQPLPWLGVEAGQRGASSVTRWREIEKFLDGYDGRQQTALDLGSNSGYFTIQLAKRGMTAIGVETLPVAVRTALYAMSRLELERAGVLTLRILPDTVGMLPAADVVVFMSLWHHFTWRHGVETATAMLLQIWERTHAVMFFDTGEREMPDEWNVPAMEPDPRTWLAGFLEETCRGSTVTHLGLHDAADPFGNAVQRNLFAVAR